MKLVYVGKGFLPGVPARDLSADEVRLYGRAKLLNSGLYREVRTTRTKRPGKAKPPVEEQQNE
jgi:hypothetical protein